MHPFTIKHPYAGRGAQPARLRRESLHCNFIHFTHFTQFSKNICSQTSEPSDLLENTILKLHSLHFAAYCSYKEYSYYCYMHPFTIKHPYAGRGAQPARLRRESLHYTLTHFTLYTILKKHSQPHLQALRPFGKYTIHNTQYKLHTHSHKSSTSHPIHTHAAYLLNAPSSSLLIPSLLYRIIKLIYVIA